MIAFGVAVGPEYVGLARPESRPRCRGMRTSEMNGKAKEKKRKEDCARERERARGRKRIREVDAIDQLGGNWYYASFEPTATTTRAQRRQRSIPFKYAKHAAVTLATADDGEN